MMVASRPSRADGTYASGRIQLYPIGPGEAIKQRGKEADHIEEMFQVSKESEYTPGVLALGRVVS
jgi:hypothetical protein